MEKGGRLDDCFFSVNCASRGGLMVGSACGHCGVHVGVSAGVADFLGMNIRSFFAIDSCSNRSPSLSAIMKLPPVITTASRGNSCVHRPCGGSLGPLLAVRRSSAGGHCGLFKGFCTSVSFPFLGKLGCHVGFSRGLVRGGVCGFGG